MWEKIWLVGLGATSALAQEPVVPDKGTWEEMYQACANGDYQAMAQWHEQCYGGEGATTGGMMGGGMMGNGWGGMMGGW